MANNGIATTAFSSVGSDLAVAVSFKLADELLDTGDDADTSPSELVAVLLALSIALVALSGMVSRARAREIKESGPESGSILEFIDLVLSIATRLCFSTTVQVLAATATSRSDEKIVRVVTLCSLSVFFVYISASAETRLF